MFSQCCAMSRQGPRAASSLPSQALWLLQGFFQRCCKALDAAKPWLRLLLTHPPSPPVLKSTARMQHAAALGSHSLPPVLVGPKGVPALRNSVCFPSGEEATRQWPLPVASGLSSAVGVRESEGGMRTGWEVTVCTTEQFRSQREWAVPG